MPDHLGVVSRAMKRKAERRLRQLLSEDGFAQPDQVEYGPSSVRLIWHSVNKSIVVDVTERGEIGESRAGPPPGAERSPEPDGTAGISGPVGEQPPPIATLKQKIAAERAGRALFERARVPPPDEVEYSLRCVRFFWNEQKVVLEIDLDELPDGPELVSDDLADQEDQAA